MTVLQRELGRRLRRLRDVAGKSESDVEQAQLMSRTKLWRLETAKAPAKPGDVRALCRLYGIDDETTDMLADWAILGKHEGCWKTFDKPMSERDALQTGLEAIAQHVLVFEPQQIPDLLQVPDYTRAQYLANRPDADESVVAGFLKHRQERQTALTQRTPPMRMTAVLDENVLTRPVGGQDVMREQHQLLQELANHVHIDIRYLPSRTGAHPAMRTGGFTIFEFADAKDPDFVYIETHTGAKYLELPTELAEYRRIFAGIYTLSVPISDYRRERQVEAGDDCADPATA